jgi:TPR repeat protein
VFFALGEKGLPKNTRKALYWYTLGAKDCDFAAQCNLALLHYYGEADVERNRWLARKWFLRAAAQGDGQAMLYLGQMHVLGEIVERDEHAAAGWFRRAKRDGWPLHDWENWLIHHDG